MSGVTVTVAACDPSRSSPRSPICMMRISVSPNEGLRVALAPKEALSSRTATTGPSDSWQSGPVGQLSVRVPSTSTRPSRRRGAKSTGSDMEAATTSVVTPRWWYTGTRS